jgi:hypothetical protein
MLAADSKSANVAVINCHPASEKAIMELPGQGIAFGGAIATMHSEVTYDMRSFKGAVR